MATGFPSEWTRFAPSPRPLGKDEKWHVFLSYRSINRIWVLNLYDVLRGLGHAVFLDQVRLPAGESLRLGLANALKGSLAGVLIWTHDSDSEWVQAERDVMEQMASERAGFRFIPIRLDTSELPILVGRRLFLDFSTYPDGPNGGELLRLLYGIAGLPLSEEALRFAADQDEAAQGALHRITAAINNNNPERLVDLFEQGGLPWDTSSATACKAAEGLTRLGRDDEAIRMLERVTERFPRAVRPKQLRALALARKGDYATAQDIVGELYARGERDPETLGIYARTWMDRYYATQPRNITFIKRSRDLYLEAFNLATDDSYTGINAASKSVLVGEREDLERAVELAQTVQNLLDRDPHPHVDRYWKIATRGEACLIQRSFAEAARDYAAAMPFAPFESGSHQSTWLQACRLMVRLRPTDEERALIRAVFKELPDCNDLPVDCQAGRPRS
jgi:tetratricopeptide (TPR) repeat protein